MGINEKLLKIQAELKVPKSQYNSFGKYNYRSCEKILEEAKPILQKHKCLLYLSDDMVDCGDRIYVQAIATIIDIETGEQIQNSSFAREAETKKGMDESQITGTASSYARKYALNGLFDLDDNKDADTDEYHEQNTEVIPLISEEEARQLRDYAGEVGIEESVICDRYGVNILEDLDMKQYASAMRSLNATVQKGARA